MNELIDQFDAERRRLARQLHDTAAQQLAALQINLSMIAKDTLSPREAQALAEASELALACARELRAVCNRLHPPLLDEVGLPAALRAFAAEVGCKLDPEFPEDIEPVPPAVALGAFRIVQELVLDSEQPENVTILLRRYPEILTVHVTSSGVEIRRGSSFLPRTEALGAEQVFLQSGEYRSLRITIPLTTAKS